MRRSLPHSLPGQSLVTVAVFALLLFLTVGLAIDGGMIYMQRRLMQNTADAACLSAANQLALDKTDAVATSAATNVIKDNLGATPGAGVNAPGTLSYTDYTQVYGNGTNVGSGLTLVKGIEIDGPDVRVALQSPAYTYFMRLLGNANYTVAARAHCNAKAGGGALPIAVARYRGFKSTSPNATQIYGPRTDQPLPQKYRKNKDMVVRDVLDGESHNYQLPQWPDWGDPGYFTNDLTCCLYSEAEYPASTTDPGIETVLAGKGARPNKGTTSFNGPIALDLRNMFPGPTEYFPPVDPSTSVQKYKDLVTQYIVEGYEGPLPEIGDTLAIQKGISAGQVEKPFAAHFRSPITVIMYDGMIYGDDDYKYDYSGSEVVSKSKPTGESSSQCKIDAGSYIFEQVSPATNPSSTNTANYGLNLDPSAAYTMRALFSTSGASFADAKGRWKDSSTTGSWNLFNTYGVAPAFSDSAATFNFELQQSAKSSCTATAGPYAGTTFTWPTRKEGAQAIYLEAKDASSGKRHARYAFIAMKDVSTDDFYVYFPGDIQYDITPPGTDQSVELAIEDIKASNGDPQNAIDITVQASGTKTITDVVAFKWFDETGAPLASGDKNNGDTFNGIKTSITQSPNKDYNLDLSVSDTAPEQKYYLRIQVTYNGITHWAWYFIDVQKPISPSTSGYVKVLGYAEFEITDMKSNYIKGRAISGLLKPDQVKVGFTARLIPWEQT